MFKKFNTKSWLNVDSGQAPSSSIVKAEHLDITPTRANLEYSARENGLDAAIKAVKDAYRDGQRDNLERIGLVAYRVEYDASMMAYRIAYKIHDDTRRALKAI